MQFPQVKILDAPKANDRLSQRKSLAVQPRPRAWFAFLRLVLSLTCASGANSSMSSEKLCTSLIEEVPRAL